MGFFNTIYSMLCTKQEGNACGKGGSMVKLYSTWAVSKGLLFKTDFVCAVYILCPCFPGFSDRMLPCSYRKAARLLAY